MTWKTTPSLANGPSKSSSFSLPSRPRAMTTICRRVLPVRPISKYLTGAAKRQFDSYNALGASRLRGFASCPEAVQHLLKSFAIGEAIIDVVAEFDGLKQSAKEEEWAFRLRVRHTARLCGNLFSENQLITRFIFGTHEDIKPIIVSSKA